MKKSIVLFTLMNVFAGQLALANKEAGNGGDVLKCLKSEQSKFEGLLSLDYLVTYNPMNQNADIVNLKSWKESAARIQGLLTRFAPKKAESWREFVELAENFSDYSKRRIWVAGPTALIRLEDENLVRVIPQNCRVDKAGLPTGILQTVIRQQNGKGGQVRYQIDSEMLSELRSEPTQFSFLMVHEWLWDFFDDASKIREVNRFLHSDWEKLSPRQIQDSLFRLELLSPDEHGSSDRYLTQKYIAGVIHDDLEAVRDLDSQAIRGRLKIEPGAVLGKTPELTNRLSRYFGFVGNWATPLEIAIVLGNERVVDYLVETESSDHVEDEYFALLFALVARNWKLADQLIAKRFPDWEFSKKSYWYPHLADFLIRELALADDADSVAILETKYRISPAAVPSAVAVFAKARANRVLEKLRQEGSDLAREYERPVELEEVSCGKFCIKKYSAKMMNPFFELAIEGDVAAIEYLLRFVPQSSLDDLLLISETTVSKGVLAYLGLPGLTEWETSVAQKRFSVRALLEASNSDKYKDVLQFLKDVGARSEVVPNGS